MNKIVRLALIGLMLLMLGVLMAYFSGAFHTKVALTQERMIVRYDGELVQAVVETRPRLEQVSGTVQATSDTLIAARIIANVRRVLVRAGDSVRKDQLLLELDDRALVEEREQRTQEAAASRVIWEEAKRNRDRMQSLRDSGTIAQAPMDRALTEERSAAADLERARRGVAQANTAVGYTRILAPINGTIVERFVEPGDIATPGQVLLKLFNPGQMRVEATVRESLVGAVALGDQLEATIDAQDRVLAVIVEEIVPSADPTSRTFLLKARFVEVARLFPGMFARLVIPVSDETPRVRIPVQAVQTAGQLRFVYVRGPTTDARRFVRLGQLDEGFVEIRSGLSGGETLVVPSSTG